MEEKDKCFNCGNTSFDKVLLHCVVKGEEKLICARCIPQFIHG